MEGHSKWGKHSKAGKKEGKGQRTFVDFRCPLESEFFSLANMNKTAWNGLERGLWWTLLLISLGYITGHGVAGSGAAYVQL